MPKAIIEFSLPEEREEHSTALHGIDYRICLDDISNKLRSLLKHGNPTPEVTELAEEIRSMIWDCYQETGTSG